MYRPWTTHDRPGSMQTSSGYPVYPDYTLDGREAEMRGGRGRKGGLALLRIGGKKCIEDPYCEEYDFEEDERPPPFTIFSGYIHVKSLTLLKLSVLILWLVRECQLQMMDQVCREQNGTLLQCSRAACAWLHLLVGGLPYKMQSDGLCNALLLATLSSALLFLGALWLRERQAAAGGAWLQQLPRPPSLLLKLVLIACQTVLEFGVTIGILVILVANVGRRKGGDVAWSSVKAFVVASFAIASCLLHLVTTMYICSGNASSHGLPSSSDYPKGGVERGRARGGGGGREERRRRVDDYEDSIDIVMAARRDEQEQGYGGGGNRQLKSNLASMQMMGNVPPAHMTQLPPGGTPLYHSGTASPVYYNEPCQAKTSSSEESGVSSVGYGRLRQALRQQARASRAAAAAVEQSPRHTIMQKQSASPHVHIPIPASSSRPDLAALAAAAASSSAASLAASSVAGIAPPPVLLSPHAAAAAAAAAPYIMEESTGDYSHVRSLRHAELMRQSAGARSRKSSPAQHRRRSSQERLLSSAGPSAARLHAADSRPESAYLEVI